MIFHNVLILVLFIVSCQLKKEPLNTANVHFNGDSLINKTILLNQGDKSIKYIDFKQDPAEEYFFTRKFRIIEEKLFYFEGDSFSLMSIKNSLDEQLFTQKTMRYYEKV